MNKEVYIKRCFDLARLGSGRVSPNPIVGAVLVFKDRIIGEGYHKQYGKAHAEVEALKSVNQKDQKLIQNATLFISLEPCCIHGKTPPCTNLILDQKIKHVVISCLDQTPGVSGKGVQILRHAGVKVETGILEKEGKQLVRIRNAFVSEKRPYILLKFAKSKDDFLGKTDKQYWLTNNLSKRLSHKWRSENAAILCGSNTVIIDNPSLTNRLFPGANPLRILLDRRGRVSIESRIFDDSSPTWVFTRNPGNFKNLPRTTNTIFTLTNDKSVWTSVFQQMNIQGKNSLLVEGGAAILEDLIQQDFWNEARVFTSPASLNNGIKAPNILNKKNTLTDQILNDRVQTLFK